MRITLGAHLLSGVPGYRQAGIHRYIKSLLPELAAIPDVHCIALISPTALGEVAPNAALEVLAAPMSTESPARRIWVEQAILPRAIGALHPDAHHAMAFAAPLAATCPTVVTVHDLSFLTRPETHKAVNRAYLSLMTRWSCRRAARVIAVSAWTKRDVARWFGVNPDRIDVVPHGVPTRFARADQARIAAFRAERGMGDRAVLFLGSLEPRKNLSTLVEAFGRLADLDAELWIAGGEGWKFSPVHERVRRLGLEGRVRFAGFVPDEDVPLWMSACDVFAYPSLYEGFGMPVIEAMACGAVVVASDATALPEVVGDAGLTAPPTDIDALAAALRRALTDAPLRADLRRRAVERATGYSWRRAAELTVQTYRRAMIRA